MRPEKAAPEIAPAPPSTVAPASVPAFEKSMTPASARIAPVAWNIPAPNETVPAPVETMPPSPASGISANEKAVPAGALILRPPPTDRTWK